MPLFRSLCFGGSHSGAWYAPVGCTMNFPEGVASTLSETFMYPNKERTRDGEQIVETKLMYIRGI